MKYKLGITIFLICVIIAAVVLLIISAFKSHGIDEFAKLGAVAATLITSTAAAFAALYNASRAADLEQVKADLTTQVELFKQTLTDERTAYKEVNNAIQVAFDALATAQGGILDTDRVKDAKAKLTGAILYTDYISETDTVLWNRFKQAVTYFLESTEGKTPDEIKKVWTASNGEMAQHLLEFKKSARAVLSPPKKSVTATGF